MDTRKTQFQYNEGQFARYDSETMPFSKDNHSSHFAVTDAFITHAGETGQPMIHFWQTSPLVILGMMDTKLGHFDKAYPLFKQYNHDTIVRNSGGLGVISDPGVLNVSLIYPSKERRLSIDEAYDFMLQFIRDTFYPHFTEKEILAYEIKNSYCFGDYDLSIDGQKIAGIAQRRIKNGLAVMLYISVNGDQKKRAEMMREFYEIGLDGSEPAGRYPEIKSNVMTTLEDAYDISLSVEQVKQMMLDQFDWVEGEYSDRLEDYYEVGLAKMHRRNTRIFGE
ncbi:MAG TPA: lipoate--protein ligase family protein [Atopostipes sp.]|nr:lipoate--protein ligase family protein [Atopostipes sp.]